jgi:glucokinase
MTLPSEKFLMGFDIGGTKCAVVLGNQESGVIRILDRTQFFTRDHDGVESVLKQMEVDARRMISSLGLDPGNLQAIGISCGGPLDHRRRIILSPPNLPGWRDVPIGDHFESLFSVPVGIENDANACALAEWRFGAGRGTRNMIFLTFGTGMGAGLILHERLYRGATGLAGEVGHIRLAENGPIGFGKAGSFEGFCSGGGIERMARQRALEAMSRGESVSYCPPGALIEGITAQSVADAAPRGDRLAMTIYEEAGRHLGEGLAILIDILNPEMVVIGGIYARRMDLLEPHASRAMASEALQLSAAACKIVPAALGESIGDFASLSVAAMTAGAAYK